MSGHSHWAGIKHRKGINDAKKGKIFTKHGKLITVAAREGGGNPEMNFQLRLAIDRARMENMPKDNIDRAIKRGTGELKDGSEIEEVTYEAYGPGNVAMLIKTLTDNKNRTVTELKTIMNKLGGKLVPAGSVAFLFKKVGFISVDPENKDISEIEMMAIDAGAEDIEANADQLLVYTKAENLQSVREGLEKEGLKAGNSGLAYISSQKSEISEAEKQHYEKLIEALEEQDDVEEIYDSLA